MSTPEQIIRDQLGGEYKPKAEQKPWVCFFEHAVEDSLATKESGRPRFKAMAFIRKIPTSPELVVRDIFEGPAMPEHKEEFPEQWQEFLRLKEQVANRNPSLMVMPGMDVASFEELKALGIKDCQGLVDYEGDLDTLEVFKHTAQKIMEISYEQFSDCGKRRATLQSVQPGRLHGNMGGVRGTVQNTGGSEPAYISGKEGCQKEGVKKEGVKKEGVADFNMSFKVM